MVFVRGAEIEGQDAFDPEQILDGERFVQAVELFRLLDDLLRDGTITHLSLCAHLEL